MPWQIRPRVKAYLASVSVEFRTTLLDLDQILEKASLEFDFSMPPTLTALSSLSRRRRINYLIYYLSENRYSSA